MVPDDLRSADLDLMSAPVRRGRDALADACLASNPSISLFTEAVLHAANHSLHLCTMLQSIMHEHECSLHVR